VRGILILKKPDCQELTGDRVKKGLGPYLAAHHHACEPEDAFESINNSKSDQYNRHYNNFEIHFKKILSGSNFRVRIKQV
jgi:hypothetical protein